MRDYKPGGLDSVAKPMPQEQRASLTDNLTTFLRKRKAADVETTSGVLSQAKRRKAAPLVATGDVLAALDNAMDVSIDAAWPAFIPEAIPHDEDWTAETANVWPNTAILTNDQEQKQLTAFYTMERFYKASIFLVPPLLHRLNNDLNRASYKARFGGIIK